MAPRPARMALIIFLFLALTASSCGGKGLGVETPTRKAGADAYNVRFIPTEKRDAPFTYQGRSFRFQATSVAGEAISSDYLAGAVSVVNFWGDWCGDCHREQPMFDAAYRRFSSRGVKFLGVNVRDATADARSFVAQYRVPYPSVFEGIYLKVAYKFGVFHFPSTYFLDGAGRVAAIMISLPESQQDLDGLIEKVLA